MIPCCCPPLDRRAFLLGLGAAVTAGCAPAPTPRRALEPLDAPTDATSSAVPWVDFHTHLQRRVTAEELIDRMDRAGVARMILMALYYGDGGGAVNDGEGTDEQAAEYARRYPTRFVPFVGMQRGILVNRNRWLSPDDVARNLVADTDRKLMSGEFFGMGEFMLRFYPYTTQLGVVAVSHPNLYADLGLMVSVGEGYGTYWPRRTPWMHLVMTPEGVVLPEMKGLFEEFSDRFLLGTDRAHARLFLSQLSPATARKLAFENAERFFRQ